MIIVDHADVRDCIDDLVALGFDALIVDPPYAPRVHDKATSVGHGGPVDRDLGFDAIDDSLRAAIARLAAHAARWSCVFSDIESASDWRAAMTSTCACGCKGAEYVRTLPWIRWSQPQISGDRPPSGCELITLAHRRCAKRWNGPGSLVAFDERSLRGADKYSCEKPLDLMLSLVSYFSDLDERVLDPCCGSGTTGLAARLLGRDALLLDCDASAVALAKRRVEAPLTPRDQERCRRWIERQEAWLSGNTPDSAAGADRYARARADTDAVRAQL